MHARDDAHASRARPAAGQGGGHKRAVDVHRAAARRVDRDNVVVPLAWRDDGGCERGQGTPRTGWGRNHTGGWRALTRARARAQRHGRERVLEDDDGRAGEQDEGEGARG